MKSIIVATTITTILLSACSTATPTKSGMPPQTAAPTPTASPAQRVTPGQEQAAPAAAIASAGSELSDLDAMTFGCPKAGLNAAAREAAKAPAQGRYQFSYFRIASDSHHSSYEVHFKSNDHGDPDLKYCVSVYCQQGWDPKTAKPSISLMSNAPRPSKVSAVGDAHIADCGDHQTHLKKRKKR